MAITSRPAALDAQLEALEAQQAASGAPDEWVAAQIDDVKQKLAQLSEQDKIWDTEHALRSHNYVGLVRPFLDSIAGHEYMLTRTLPLATGSRRAAPAGQAGQAGGAGRGGQGDDEAQGGGAQGQGAADRGRRRVVNRWCIAYPPSCVGFWTVSGDHWRCPARGWPTAELGSPDLGGASPLAWHETPDPPGTVEGVDTYAQVPRVATSKSGGVLCSGLGRAVRERGGVASSGCSGHVRARGR